MTNKIRIKIFEILGELLKCKAQKKSKKKKCCWKNGVNKLAQHRVATNLQFVKNAIPAKWNKAKYNKMRYDYTVASFSFYMDLRGRLQRLPLPHKERLCFFTCQQDSTIWPQFIFSALPPVSPLVYTLHSILSSMIQTSLIMLFLKPFPLPRI